MENKKHWSTGNKSIINEVYNGKTNYVSVGESKITNAYGKSIGGFSLSTEIPNWQNRDWSIIRQINHVGIGINIEENTSLSLNQICGFENEESYDKFVEIEKDVLKHSPALMKYDVVIREPNGCRVSYTFELFKNILFPKN